MFLFFIIISHHVAKNANSNRYAERCTTNLATDCIRLQLNSTFGSYALIGKARPVPASMPFNFRLVCESNLTSAHILKNQFVCRNNNCHWLFLRLNQTQCINSFCVNLKQHSLIALHANGIDTHQDDRFLILPHKNSRPHWTFNDSSPQIDAPSTTPDKLFRDLPLIEINTITFSLSHSVIIHAHSATRTALIKLSVTHPHSRNFTGFRSLYDDAGKNDTSRVSSTTGHLRRLPSVPQRTCPLHGPYLSGVTSTARPGRTSRSFT